MVLTPLSYIGHTVSGETGGEVEGEADREVRGGVDVPLEECLRIPKFMD